MELTYSQIKNITLGAAYISQTPDGYLFHRFTEEQENLYQEKRPLFYSKTLCCSGVKLRFRTDSNSLVLEGKGIDGIVMRYPAIEVQVDGVRVDAIADYVQTVPAADGEEKKYILGTFARKYDLAPGTKEICIYLPWSIQIALRRVALDAGACVAPVKPKNKMLCFGDSITQGYFAAYPSAKYATRLAEYLDAEEYNKAIGGDIFFPELALVKDDFEPDYISVAYGTNDWFKSGLDKLKNYSREFYTNIHNTYPNAKVFAISPLWRKDLNVPGKCCAFEQMYQVIADAVAGYDNMIVIRGTELVPHEENYFGDLRLHPNDKGFECYFEGLKKRISP